MNPELQNISQIKINFNAPDLKTFRAAVEWLTGLSVKPDVTVTPPPEDAPPVREKPESTMYAKPEKGAMEKEFLDRSGLERMRVPSDWQGSREEYATHRLHLLNFPASGVAGEPGPPSLDSLPEDDGKAFAWED